jgi:hypothetical protein
MCTRTMKKRLHTVSEVPHNRCESVIQLIAHSIPFPSMVTPPVSPPLTVKLKVLPLVVLNGCKQILHIWETDQYYRIFSVDTSFDGGTVGARNYLKFFINFGFFIRKTRD